MQHLENQIYFICPDVILFLALTTADQLNKGMHYRNQRITQNYTIAHDAFSVCENVICEFSKI
jgi:hypothetical protein